MQARVAVYDKKGITRKGELPVIDLTFSEEVGGSGSCTFEALMSDIDALSAWDAVILIELESESGEWIPGPAYVTRHQYTHKAGSRRFAFQCRSLLEAWASETVFLPEYTVSTMPRKAGTQRGIGWMSSAYQPANDPSEPWTACYEPDRSMRPDDWPSGSGAKWITASGSTSETESKYFRTVMSVTGSEKLIKFYLSSDESAVLWVGGEQLISTSSTEDGKKEYEKARLWMHPGNYAVGIYTETAKSKGGDGIDPVILAAEHLDGEGEHVSWVLATNESTWMACRRDNEPPDDVPPGPTPGEVLFYLIGEAQERKAAGWENVVTSFDLSGDSYGAPWADVIEQMFNYGQHTYWNAFESWAESDQFDVWLTWVDGYFTLNAAKRQGQQRDIIFTEEHFWTFGTSGTEGHGTWVIAQAHDGWLFASKSGPRREYALELGEALTRPIARKIAKASLKDSWRWDAAGSMNPPKPGWMPYVDFGLGDWMHVSYRAVEHDLSVTSLSAKAGEGGLMWDVEFTEWPAEASINP